MINLTQTSNNHFFLTLSQDTILTGLTSAYTLSIISSQSNQTYTYTINDISLHKTRYNEFNLSGITIDIGYYDYEISQNSNILEKGKVNITGSTITKLVDIQTDNNKKLIDNRL